MTPSYRLFVLPEKYGVVKLDPGTEINTKGGNATELLAVIHTPEETTVVCQEKVISPGKEVEKGWKALKVEGTLEFGLVGLLASITTPLAENGISVYTLSTYSTDFILVKANLLSKAIKALKKAGFEIVE
jgi:uncharacterized protein